MNGHQEYPGAKLEMGEALSAGASSVRAVLASVTQTLDPLCLHNSL